MNADTPPIASAPSPLSELFLVFLKLGALSMGGPAAHLALMEREFVQNRGWVSRQDFLDTIGAMNLIPGPVSVEVALNIGWRRRGLAGLLAAGAGFCLPAIVLTLLLAWLYVHFGQAPQLNHIMTGVQGVVLALIAVACWHLAKIAARSWFLVALGVGAFAMNLAGLNEIAVLVLAGGIGILFGRTTAAAGSKTAALVVGLAALPSAALAAAAGAGVKLATISLASLGLGFLAVGCMLYGSGYVLIAFLDDWLIHETGLMTATQLADAIAVGNITPGPVTSAATFIGYSLHGMPGAAVATLGMFLPAFVLVQVLSPWLPRLRRYPWTARFLDAVNVASVALICAVLLRLGMAVATNWLAPTMFLVTLVVALKRWCDPLWLIPVAAGAGWLAGWLGWIA